LKKNHYAAFQFFDLKMYAMKTLSHLLVFFLLGLTQMSHAQRNFDNANLTYCQRTGKAIYMYDANFVKLGLVRPHSEMGRSNENPAAGFTNEGIMAQFGFMRYFDLDINRSRFGIGYFVPLYASYNPWENSALNELVELERTTYLFIGAGIGPLLTIRLVDRVLLDMYATAQPTVSFYGGYKHEMADVSYNEYSFISFNVGSVIGASLRYRFLIVGCEWLPLNSKYNVYMYEDGEAIDQSPEKRKMDVGRVSASVGVYF
jgi:hypothetical protein